MRIAIVTRNMGAGGAERVIAQLIEEWSAMGHCCSLICMHPEEAFYSIPEGVEWHNVPKFAENYNVDKLLRYRYLRKLLKQISPDIVLSLPEEIGIYVIAAMLGTGIPVVVSERNNPWRMPDKKISRILRKLVYPFSAGLIFQTECAAAFFSKAQRKKGIILQNPLDLSRIPEPYGGTREKVIVGAGRLEPQKNFKLLIDAFVAFYPNHPDYRLVIYGDGKQRAELEAYALERIPENVFSLPGKVQNLPDRLNCAAAFVLSSDFEGMPNVLIEAMAMGVPCVSTDCPSGGPRELIEDGVNGLLIPVGDSEALARCLEKLVTETDIRPNAQQIRARFDCKIVAAQWEQYLLKVANGREICG